MTFPLKKPLHNVMPLMEGCFCLKRGIPQITEGTLNLLFLTSSPYTALLLDQWCGEKRRRLILKSASMCCTLQVNTGGNNTMDFGPKEKSS